MSPVSRHASRSNPAVELRRERALKAFGRRLFTREEALANGLLLSDLRSRAVLPVARGVFMAAHAGPVTRETRYAAEVLRLGAGAAVAGYDAARLWRLPVPDDDRIHLTVPRVSGRSHTGSVIKQRHAGVRLGSVWISSLNQALPVTAMMDVLPELCRQLPLVDGVVLADAALTRLNDESGGKAYWIEHPAGCARLHEIVALARRGAESPMETKLRLLLGWAGLDVPALQVPVHVGAKAYRFDLAYEDHRVAIEYDGAYHFESERQKHSDILRAQALEQAGWQIVRVVSRGILRDPTSTITRVRVALHAAGVHTQPSDEWRKYFAQRDPVKGFMTD